MVDTVIYAVENGNLKRYLDQDGGNIGDGVIIKYSWSNFKSSFTGVVGEIFAITDNGELWRAVDIGTDEVYLNRIGSGGWNQYLSVFYGGNNIIYAITTGGQLWKYMVNGDADIGTSVVIGYGSWQNVKVVP
jgi:hypothetical protein